MNAGAGAQVIARTSLHDELTARLRALIDEGELAPGARVPEKALCERFGVSRTPLRETLKVLAAEGLVDLLPQRGARVARLTVEDVEAMFPVIGALEGLAGELACARIDDHGIARIEALHRRMRAAYCRRDRATYFALNRQIHESLLEATGNPVLIATYRGLAGRIRNARYVAAMTASQWAAAVEQHDDILRALQRRDGPALARLLRAHLAGKCDSVKSALAGPGAAG